MNYLGHAYLSFGDPEILFGNMIGDSVKGKAALGNYPEGIRKGIELHRKIDSFTDSHNAILRAKIWFRPYYHLYSGAILDTIFDHYLANDAKLFHSEKDLLDFTQQSYDHLESFTEFYPDDFAYYFPYMKTQNWLYNSRTLKGIHRSLEGLERKAKNIEPIKKAQELMLIHYYELNQCYYELISDLIPYVKNELKH